MNLRVSLAILLGIALVGIASCAKESTRSRETWKPAKQSARLSRRSRTRLDDEKSEISVEETGKLNPPGGDKKSEISVNDGKDADKKPPSDDDKRGKLFTRNEKKNRKLDEDRKRKISARNNEKKIKKAIDDDKKISVKKNEKKNDKRQSDDESDEKNNKTPLDDKNNEKKTLGESGKLLSLEKEEESKMAAVRAKRSTIFCIEVKPNGECVQPVAVPCSPSLAAPSIPSAIPYPMHRFSPIVQPTQPAPTQPTTTTTPRPCPEPRIVEKEVPVVIEHKPPYFMIFPPDPPTITKLQSNSEDVQNSVRQNISSPALLALLNNQPASHFSSGTQGPTYGFPYGVSSAGALTPPGVYNPFYYGVPSRVPTSGSPNAMAPAPSPANEASSPVSGPPSGALPVSDSSQNFMPESQTRPPKFYKLPQGHLRGKSIPLYAVEHDAPILMYTEQIPQMRSNEIDNTPREAATWDRTEPIAIIATETDPSFARFVAQAYRSLPSGYPVGPTSQGGYISPYAPASTGYQPTAGNNSQPKNETSGSGAETTPISESTTSVQSSNGTEPSRAQGENSSQMVQQYAPRVPTYYVPIYQAPDKYYSPNTGYFPYGRSSNFYQYPLLRHVRREDEKPKLTETTVSNEITTIVTTTEKPGEKLKNDKNEKNDKNGKNDKNDKNASSEESEEKNDQKNDAGVLAKGQIGKIGNLTEKIERKKSITMDDWPKIMEIGKDLMSDKKKLKWKIEPKIE